MPKELRCKGTMFGILDEDHEHLEVKCKRRSCGAKKGVVVLHNFDLKTGAFTTKRYADPGKDYKPCQ